MSEVAKNNLEEYITAKPKVTYVDLCTAFELTSKRTIDEALESLVLESRIISGLLPGGGRYYVSRRANKPGKKKAPGQHPNFARPGKTHQEQIDVYLATADDRVTIEELREALPNIKRSSLDALTSRMCLAGKLFRETPGVFHQSPPGAKPKYTSEAEKREADASATSEMPAAIATPAPVGDAHDESAALKSPVSGIGPAPASTGAIALQTEDDDLNEILNETPEKTEGYATVCLSSGDVNVEISGPSDRVIPILQQLNKALVGPSA